MCRHHHGERGHVSCLTGTKGRNKGEFTNLQGVAASSQGKVLIADSNNQCVQVRTNSLKHLRLFSEIIYENYLIFNIVFYFILFFNQIQIFSNDGQFRSRFGIRGRTPGQLQRPTGVAVHPNGDIIIADYDNKWVSIFSSEGKFKVSFIYLWDWVVQ